MKDDLKFSCALEPDDDRNFMLVEDFTVDLSVTVQHVAYGLRYRLKRVLRLLFTGIDANDITLDEGDVIKLSWWLKEWVEAYLHKKESE